MELSAFSLDKILLFFFSAIGVINTVFLALYFSLFIKNRSLHNRLLSALFLVIGLREIKSVLVLFQGNHIGYLGFFGQSVDALIGPLLYLYINTYQSHSKPKRYTWVTHTLPYTLIMSVVYFVIKSGNQAYTNYSFHIGGIIYIQWITYIGLSINKIKSVINKLFKRQKLEKKEWWLVNLIGSVFIIWLAYVQTHYGNYVLGGVSISAVLYLSLFFWLYGRKSEFYEAPPKYGNKKIPEAEASQLLSKFDTLMAKEELYLNPDVKLAEIASRLDTSAHLLSQILNDNLQVNFNQYLNKFRIQAATEMIKTNHRITLEAIGVEVGFKSKSAFYAAFKSIQGQTPAQFRKAYLSN